MNDERLRQLYQQGLTAREARASRDGAPCAVSPDDLLALARGELPEEQRLELLDQVMVSARCRQELDLLRAVVAAERESLAAQTVESGGAPVAAAPPALRVVRGGAPRTSEPARTRAWWRGPGVTAAVAATLLVAVGIGQIARSRAHATAGAPDVTRGAGDAVAVVAPGTAVDAGAPVTFVWRPTAGATRYALDVADAGGTAVYETATRDTSVTLPAAVALRAGTAYRWIVRATDDAGTTRGTTVRQLDVRAP